MTDVQQFDKVKIDLAEDPKQTIFSISQRKALRNQRTYLLNQGLRNSNIEDNIIIQSEKDKSIWTLSQESRGSSRRELGE